MKINKENDTLTLVDFYSFYYRAINPKALFKLSSNDVITGGMFNLLRSYFKILKNYSNILLVMDEQVNKRKQMNKEYKSNRDSKNFELVKQGVNIWQWRDEFLSTVPYYSISYSGYEADDLIAGIVNVIKKKELSFTRVLIITLDTDLLQLVDNNTTFFVNLKDNWSFYTPEKLFEKFGITDYRNILYHKALFGDKADNIPQVVKKGTRKKPILNYLNEKGFEYIHNLTLDKLVDEINSLYKQSVIEDINRLASNLRLISLDSTVITNKNDVIDRLNYSAGNKDIYNQLLEKYNFKQVPKFKDIFETLTQRNSLLSNLTTTETNSLLNELI